MTIPPQDVVPALPRLSSHPLTLKRVAAARATAIVGVDAGKRHHALVVRTQDGRYSRPLRFETNRQGFEHAVEFVKAFVGFPYHASATLVGIEFAGYYGFTFAHFLHELAFPIVNVLPSHTKRWKEVMHRQPLKTDEKDSVSIADLVLNGHYVRFPFLEREYAELRFLTSSRERLTLQRRAVISRLRSILDIVFPEFDTIFPVLTSKTPRPCQPRRLS